MPFYSDRFTPLSASFLQGYYRFAKKDTRFASFEGTGIEDDIGQYDEDLIRSGTWLQSSGALSGHFNPFPRTLDAMCVVNSASQGSIMSFFGPGDQSNWGEEWGELWGGEAESFNVYEIMIESGSLYFIHNTERILSGPLTTLDASYHSMSVHWACERDRAQADPDRTRHEVFVFDHFAGTYYHRFGYTDDRPYGGTGTYFLSGSPSSGSIDVVAARVSDAFHPIAEHVMDYVLTQSINPGTGSFDHDRPVLNNLGQGDYFGPTPAMAMLHTEHMQRRTLTPYNKVFHGLPRFTWTNFEPSQDIYTRPMQSGSAFMAHMGWLGHYALPEHTPINAIALRVNALVTGSGGQLDLRFGCMTSPPGFPGPKEIYYATGSISGSGVSGWVVGHVPIARRKHGGPAADETTTIFVAVSGSAPELGFEIRSISAMPMYVSESGGFGLQIGG